MAKHDDQKHSSTSSTPAVQEPTPATTSTATPTNGTAAAPTVPDERYKKITLDDAGSTFGYGDTSKSGSVVNRIDFIRSAWQVGKQARGAIAKELTRLAGKKITYQIVFSATKGLAGGPTPAPAAAGTPATPAG